MCSCEVMCLLVSLQIVAMLRCFASYSGPLTPTRDVLLTSFVILCLSVLLTELIVTVLSVFISCQTAAVVSVSYHYYKYLTPLYVQRSVVYDYVIYIQGPLDCAVVRCQICDIYRVCNTPWMWMYVYTYVVRCTVEKLDRVCRFVRMLMTR